MEGSKKIPVEVLNSLGDMLTEHLCFVSNESEDATFGMTNIQSLKELRVTHAVIRNWRRGVTCSVTELADQTQINKATVSRAVTAMMVEGLVREEPDLRDGRRRIIVPTEKGLETLNEVQLWMHSWALRIIEQLKAAEESESADGITVELNPLADTQEDAASK